MKLNDEDRAKVAKSHSAYIHGKAQPVFNYDLRDIAAELKLLPMMNDMGGCFAMSLDGEIVSFTWEQPTVLRTETEPSIIRTVLFQGSKKHPALASLVPQRPAAAIDCPSCSGSGTCVPATPDVFDAFVCVCGGLGWV